MSDLWAGDVSEPKEPGWMATAAATAPVVAAATSVSKARKLPAPNSDFYQLVEVLTDEELAIVRKVRTYMETKVQPIINKYWSDDAFPFELLPLVQGPEAGRPGLRRLWLRRWQPEAVRLRRHGAGSRRRLVLHVLRRPQRSGDGLDLSRRIGGAEAEVAAADGALREDRLLRPDRAPGRLGDGRWPHDHGKARRRHLGAEWPEALDRQLALVRPVDHLGSRWSPTIR